MLPKKIYIVSALLVLMILGFTATSLTSYFVANDSISAQLAEQTLPLTSDNIYSEIQRDLLRPILISSVMASDTFLRDWVMDGETDLDKVQAYLHEIQESYGMITASFISERTRHYYHPRGILKTLSEDDPADAWYFRVREMREPFEINIDRDTADRNRLSIFINYRVFDYSGGYLGATGVGLSLESVTHLLDTYQQRYGRRIYFADRQGVIRLTAETDADLFERNLRDQPGLAPLVNQLISMPSASLEFTDEDGERVYLNSRLVPEFDWYLIVEQHGNEQSERLRQALWTNIAIGIAIMCIVIGAAWFTMQSYQRRLEAMATTDRLTGIANRHAFEHATHLALANATRRDKPACLLLFDIDNFKAINDDWGHNTGDQILAIIATLLRKYTRESDMLCRWGGEEFMLLMDNCPLDEAQSRAETILQAVRTHAIPLGKERLHLTLSCGIAQYHKGEDINFFINRVDQALYTAKNEGRDRISLASDT